MKPTLPDMLRPIVLSVDREAIEAYARITGDFNPIHVDPVFAATTEMGGLIAHGTMSLNLLWQSLEATWEGSAPLPWAVQVRFVRPVRVGDRLEAGGQRRSASDGYDVWVRNQDGFDVISGRAFPAEPDAAPKPGPEPP